MPRAAVLSIHARVAGTTSRTWEDPTLVQLWGPRFQVYVVAARDLPIFSVARYPDDARGRRVAEEMAAGLRATLGDRRMPDRDAAETMGVGNRIRYAAPTGTVLIRWEGARAPTIWIVSRPSVEPLDARLELARRYLHVYGPTAPAAFAKWAGIGTGQAVGAFDALARELLPVRTPIGDAWMLAADEATVREPARPAAPARLLPSGDAYFLLHGADRELLVPEANRRDLLWTSRVWPGAMLMEGEIAGTWRRAGSDMTVETWRPLSIAERAAVEVEAASLPLPNSGAPIRVRWAS
jgi:hypothetical protein